MLVEPDLDRRALAAVLSEQYGLAVRRLRFVPRRGDGLVLPADR
jgi:hypothetical protein